MTKSTPGIHHVTAIASDPQRNLEFYTRLLGLRLVKLTVNFDVPETYHLYYGDEAGRPGTILTFFPWPDAPKGRAGTGQAAVVAFSVPEGALGHWMDRLRTHGIDFEGPGMRFDEQFLEFRDPDGLRLELVSQAGAGGRAIRGFHSVTLWEQGHERTAELLMETLGFRFTGQAGNRFRYRAGAGGPGGILDVLDLPGTPLGRVAVGTVHHVAWRAADQVEQQAWREEIARQGFNVTPVIDREYFRSIYFREPGGVLFEIATDPPGFTVDEPLEELGTHLRLPRWLEPRRRELERSLPPLQLLQPASA
jgi:catechol 2,3-dioxygenase-like lactoylglutathione lyase family enzyme